MSELTALQKHTCAACGAQAVWNPGKQALICPFCGTVAPAEIEPATGQIREIDLVAALRELPEDLRGWQAEKRTVRCQSCQAVSVFDPERVAQNCEFCGSPALVDYTEIKAPIRPESLLPFKIAESRVREDIRRWFGTKWLAPNRFKKRALIDTVHGVYLPYWTFDAQVHCPWTADAGHYYYESETFRDSKGQRQTRRVQKVRWTPASGTVDHFFDDTPVSGSRGVDLALLREIEPFPNQELVPYDKAYVSGFVVEHYQVVLVDAAKSARERMDGELYAMCAREVPGDTHRNLRIFPEYSGQTFKHILTSVWLLHYNYGSRTFQVVVNGSTGKIAGRYPKSGWKIFFLIVAVIVVILIVRALAG